MKDRIMIRICFQPDPDPHPCRILTTALTPDIYLPYFFAPGEEWSGGAHQADHPSVQAQV